MIIGIFAAILAAIVLAAAIVEAVNRKEPEKLDYSDKNNWVHIPDKIGDTEADVFFLCPTVYSGFGWSRNLRFDDEMGMKRFRVGTIMQKGIYGEHARFFAPYYRQIGMAVYMLPAKTREFYLERAYQDVKAAFEYYLKHKNNSRPIVLAGFSQGADMCQRLLRDYFASEEMYSKLVACYAVGWIVLEDVIAKHPHMKFAEGEDDVGVIISFNGEAESITHTPLIKATDRTLAINPLNWKTTSEKADKSLNLGACFLGISGRIEKEIPQLTGAYIDERRGSLKVTDVTKEEYPSRLFIFKDGVYHLYDFQFFYRNLQKNVKTRIDAYMKKQKSEA